MGQRTQLFYEPPRDVTMQQYMDAMYSTLLDGRFLFDFVHENRLQLRADQTVRSTIILPNTALLSDAQCQQLRDYVNQGGSLRWRHSETSMYNERNERRADFGLADVFGIHAAGPVIGPAGKLRKSLHGAHRAAAPDSRRIRRYALDCGRGVSLAAEAGGQSSAHSRARLHGVSAGAFLSTRAAHAMSRPWCCAKAA